MHSIAQKSEALSLEGRSENGVSGAVDVDGVKRVLGIECEQLPRSEFSRPLAAPTDGASKLPIGSIDEDLSIESAGRNGVFTAAVDGQLNARTDKGGLTTRTQQDDRAKLDTAGGARRAVTDLRD
ncbi:MAG: hypothetical protein ACREMQ_10420 [Longimicrobiales bacterium]